MVRTTIRATVGGRMRTVRVEGSLYRNGIDGETDVDIESLEVDGQQVDLSPEDFVRAKCAVLDAYDGPSDEQRIQFAEGHALAQFTDRECADIVKARFAERMQIREIDRGLSPSDSRAVLRGIVAPLALVAAVGLSFYVGVAVGLLS